MLSGESATGKFPEESVTMLAKIAAFTEVHRSKTSLAMRREMGDILVNPKAMLVDRALVITPCDAVLVPTRDGSTARAVARWITPVWVVAAGSEAAAMQWVALCYGLPYVGLGHG